MTDTVIINPNTPDTVIVGVGQGGSIGPANTLAIGTVVRGTLASATITGTSPNQILNLVLPKGDTGAIGVVISNNPPDHSQLWADTSTNNAQVAVFDGGTPSAQITSIKIRRGLSTAWTTQVLDAGEIGFETDTRKFKVGDGSTAWSGLNYAVGVATTVPAAGLTGGTLASVVTNSSLTSFGTSPTLNAPTITGSVSGGTINGGSA